MFLEFLVKNGKEVLYHAKRPDIPIEWDDTDPAQAKTIQYQFPKSLLDAKVIDTKIVFAVGPKPLNNFRMIERHYFRNTLLRSYDFSFGFCIPNTVNSLDASYEVPAIDDGTKKLMIENPGETVSDSFYFIDDKLVLHNKATYCYI